MASEARARGSHYWLDHREVIFRRRDRDVAHRGRKRRKLRLHVGASAIPAQERMDRKGMAQIMDARNASVGGTNIRLAKERAHGHSEALTGVGFDTAMIAYEERRTGSMRQSPALTQKALHLGGSAL